MKGKLSMSMSVFTDIKPEIMEGFVAADRKEGVNNMVKDVEEMLRGEFSTSESDNTVVFVEVLLEEVDEEGRVVHTTRSFTNG